MIVSWRLKFLKTPRQLLWFYNCLAATIVTWPSYSDSFSLIIRKHGYQAELVLIYMVLYRPNFSLMFLIDLFLYTSVYRTSLRRTFTNLDEHLWTVPILVREDSGPVQTPLHSCAEPNWWIKYLQKSCVWINLVRQF